MRGDFRGTDRLFIGKICFCDSFWFKTASYNNLLFTIFPKRIPLIREEEDNSNGELVGFKIIQYIDVDFCKNKLSYPRD